KDFCASFCLIIFVNLLGENMSFSRDACEQLSAQKIVEYVELAKALIAVAKMDLEAARVLYRERLYPQAIFYAEQSSEKIAKAFLLTFIIEEVSSTTTCEISTLEDELKNVHGKFRSIGHDVIKFTIIRRVEYGDGGT
ncbi:MAG: HEPN domain-containing protein, partial [Nanopusillaceae archaeon]